MRVIPLFLLVVACGGGGDGTADIDGGASDGATLTDAGEVDGASPTISLTSTGRVRIRAGGSGALTVTLGGAVMGATTIRATSTPPGVTIAPVTVTAAGDVEIVVMAGAGALPSSVATMLVATDDDDARTAQLVADVLVVGAAGTLDTTYSADGRLDVTVPDGARKKIVFESDYDFFLVEASYRVRRRKASDGALDATWTQEGLANVLGTDLLAVPNGHLAIQRTFLTSSAPFGDIAVHDSTGHRLWLAEQPLAIVEPRFANGVLYIHSQSTGPTGYIKTFTLTGVSSPVVTGGALDIGGYDDLQVDSSGRVVVSGLRSPQVAIGRYLATGAVDTTFGSGGVFEIANPLPNPQGLNSADIVVASGGAGYAAVYFYGSAGGRVYLVPFTSSGVASSPIPVTAQHAESFASRIVLQPDGKVLVSGSDAGVGFVRRYTASGVLDTTFATGGTLTLARVPDELTMFGADDRAVVTTIEQSAGGATVHLTRFWL